MTMDRRKMLKRASVGLLMPIVPMGLSVNVYAKPSPAIAALSKSKLIYLSPFLSNGEESTCHGEVWFVHHEQDIFVVTQSDAWRAQAIRQGLQRAAVWVGEFGVWTRAKDRYRSAPYLRAKGALESDQQVQSATLDVFGEKYSDEWGSWGPRFRQGLADGSRVLLRYQIEV